MTDKEFFFESQFEYFFEKALKSLGYLFPSTDSEVDLFEAYNKLEEIPENYCNPIDLLSRSKIVQLNAKNILELDKPAVNLARAARKGYDIPDDILNKMKSDRDRAEDEKEQV